jgi:hypothetical protein
MKGREDIENEWVNTIDEDGCITNINERIMLEVLLDIRDVLISK